VTLCSDLRCGQPRSPASQRLADLVKKRDDYMTAERSKKPAKSGNSFDRAVETTLRAQIK
jgi:hypothetical protein